MDSPITTFVERHLHRSCGKSPLIKYRILSLFLLVTELQENDSLIFLQPLNIHWLLICNETQLSSRSTFLELSSFTFTWILAFLPVLTLQTSEQVSFSFTHFESCLCGRNEESNQVTKAD
jgi:hypothetical protein